MGWHQTVETAPGRGTAGCQELCSATQGQEGVCSVPKKFSKCGKKRGTAWQSAQAVTSGTVLLQAGHWRGAWMPKAVLFLRTEQGDKFLVQIFNNDAGMKQKGEM